MITIIESKKTKKQIDDKIVLIMLSIKLNGFEDICKKIINFKDENEMKIIKDYYIETDFYNWLTHDLYIRGCYDEKCGFSIGTIQDDYYNTYGGGLGLKQTDKVRNTSLSECFKSKWWKTTKKNYYDWCKIHYYFNFNKIIKIYYTVYNVFENEDDKDEIISKLECDYIWRDPTIREKNIIIDNYRQVKAYDESYLTIINSKTPENYLLIDSELKFMIY